MTATGTDTGTAAGAGTAPALLLSAALARALLEHARREAPREALGLLFGAGERARRHVPLPNVATDPERFFRAEPLALLAALRGADEAGDALVALYHSHPRGPDTPSRRDLAEARYRVPTLIVVPGAAVLRAFTLRGDDWLERDLVVLREDAVPGASPGRSQVTGPCEAGAGDGPPGP